MEIDVINLETGDVQTDIRPLDAVEYATWMEARVLECAFEVLEDLGKVRMEALKEKLQSKKERKVRNPTYAELKVFYTKWNMKEWRP